MKGKFTKIMAAVALLVGLTIPMGMRGQTSVTLTQSNLELTGSYTTNTEKTIDGITYVYTDLMKNSNNIQAKASTGTIKNSTAYSGDITSVAITHSGTERATTINGSANGTDWTQVATGSGSITADFSGKGYKYFQITRGSNAAYWTQIVITYSDGGSSTVAAPTFNPAGGDYTTTQNVTLSCETQGSTIYYTTDGSTPDNTSTEYNGTITVSETTTIKAIAYVGDDASSVASATYNIVQPLATMQAIYDKATAVGNTATYTYITLGDWVVSGVSTNGKNVFVTDGTKGFVIFDSDGSMGFTAGDILSGTVYCKVQLYTGFAELTLLNSTTSGISIATGGSVTAASIAMANLAGVNTGALVHYDNLTCSVDNSGNTTKYYLTDGTTTLLVYNALYAFGSSLQNGHKYNITGVYQQFNDTKEILPRGSADIVEVQDPVIIADNLTLAYDATSGEIQYNINNPTTGVILSAALTTGDWITSESITVENDKVTFTCSANEGTEDRTATITLSYTGASDKVVTVTQTHYVAEYATLPFAFDGGIADIASTDGLTQEGLGTDYSSSPKLKFDGTGDFLILQINERPGTLTFDIKGNGFSGGTFKVQTSEDGETYTDLDTYTELGNTQSESFNNLGENVRYIKWIYTQKVSGNVALGKIALAKYVEPVIEPSITFNPDVVDLEAEMQTVQIPFIYENIVVTNYQSFTVHHYDAEGEEIQLPDTPWYILGVTGSNDEGYELTGLVTANEGEARSAYMKVSALDAAGSTVYSNLVTINQAAYVIPFEGGTYQLATSIESGETYIITSELFVDEIYAMGADRGNNRGAVSVDIDETTITVEPGQEVYEFVITSLDNPQGFYSIYDPRNAGYLYAAGGTSSNYLKTKADLDNKGQWTITFGENNEVSIVANFGNEKAGDPRNTMRFNSTNNPPIFSCYATGGQSDVYLYKKVETTPDTETCTLTINGYTDAESKAGYYLIASPVTVNIADVDGLTEGDFDLYSYDESQELEWINYKQEDGSHPFTTLEPGKGYLYAKKATAETSTYTFTLTGTPYCGTPIVLSKQSTGTLAGWNLIGNPLATSNIAPGRAFYIMNSTIGELIASESNTVEPMRGFFVIADEDGEEFELTVPLGGDGNLDKLVMNLSQNRGTVIDRAIVRFGEGEQLPKFQLFENSTKLYIPQGNSDYAIVRSAAEGEMPVNFKAKENGTYTISVNTENVEMDYLHLIDNMTGTDVDLLATPSYTFEATTRDYASRFRLVFNTNGNNAEGNANFAYFNGSEWQISNIGEATLQVVDVMGRIVKSVALEGNATVSINEMPGVYMMRLLNGNDVKVQKVVIR